MLPRQRQVQLARGDTSHLWNIFALGGTNLLTAVVAIRLELNRPVPFDRELKCRANLGLI